MAQGAINLSCLLITQQTTMVTMLTPGTTDLVETIGPAKVKVNPNVTPLELVGGSFDQDASIPGYIDNDVTFQVPMRAKAADDVGQCGKLMRLCAMVEAEGTDGVFTYNFTSARASMYAASFLAYGGNLDTNGTIRQGGYNAVLSPKWTIEGGKYATMDITMKSCFIPWATATAPTVTKERTLPSAFVGATTMTVMADTDYKVISATIDPQQEVRLTKDPSATYGMGVSVVTNRKIKWTAKVYRDVLATVDPMTALLGKTIAAVTFEYGTAPQKVKFDMTYCQITDIEQDDEEGVETWTLSGLCERNNLTITLSTK